MKRVEEDIDEIVKGFSEERRGVIEEIQNRYSDFISRGLFSPEEIATMEGPPAFKNALRRFESDMKELFLSSIEQNRLIALNPSATWPWLRDEVVKAITMRTNPSDAQWVTQFRTLLNAIKDNMKDMIEENMLTRTGTIMNYYEYAREVEEFAGNDNIVELYGSEKIGKKKKKSSPIKKAPSRRKTIDSDEEMMMEMEIPSSKNEKTLKRRQESEELEIPASKEEGGVRDRVRLNLFEKIYKPLPDFVESTMEIPVERLESDVDFNFLTLGELFLKVPLAEQKAERFTKTYVKFLSKDMDIWLKFDSSSRAYRKNQSGFDLVQIDTILEKLRENKEIMNPVAFLTEDVPNIAHTFISSLSNVNEGNMRDLENCFSAGCGFLYAMLSYTGENLMVKAEGIFEQRKPGKAQILKPTLRDEFARYGYNFGAVEIWNRLTSQIFGNLGNLGLKLTPAGERLGPKVIMFFYGFTDEQAPHEYGTLNFVSTAPRAHFSYGRLKNSLKRTEALNAQLENYNLIERIVGEIIGSAVTPDLFLTCIVLLTSYFCTVTVDQRGEKCIDYILRTLPGVVQGRGRRPALAPVLGDGEESRFFTLILKMIETILPQVLRSNYRELARRSYLGEDTPILDYFASGGFRLQSVTTMEEDPTYEADRSLDMGGAELPTAKFKPEQLKVRPGHVLTSLRTQLLDFANRSERETMFLINAEALRLINYFVISTPFLGFNIGNIYEESQPAGENIAGDMINVLAQYLSVFAIGLINGVPSGQKVYSIAIKPQLAILVNDEMTTDLFDNGGMELLNSELFNEQEGTIHHQFYNLLRRYLQFLKAQGDYLNEHGVLDEVMNGKTDPAILGDLVRERRLAAKLAVEDYMVDLPLQGYFKKLNNESFIGEDRFENIKEVVDKIETSHDSFYIVNLMIKLKDAEDGRLQKVLEGNKLEEFMKSAGSKLKIRAVSQFKFIVNLVNSTVNINTGSEFFKQISTLLESTHTIKSLRSVINDRPLLERLAKFSGLIFQNDPKDEKNRRLSDRLLSVKDFTKRAILLSTEIVLDNLDFELYRNFRNYRLFSRAKNDPFSLDNTALYPLAPFCQARTEFFFTKNIPCGFLAIWVYIMSFLTGIFNDRERDYAISDVESIYNKIQSMLVEREEERFNMVVAPRQTITLVTRSVINLKDQLNTVIKPADVSEMEEYIHLVPKVEKTLEEELIFEQAVLTPSVKSRGYRDPRNHKVAATIIYRPNNNNNSGSRGDENSMETSPMESPRGGLSRSHSFFSASSRNSGESSSQHISDDRFTMDQKYLVNTALQIHSTFIACLAIRNTDSRTILNVVEDDHIVFPQIVPLLATAASDGLGDFLMTLGNYLDIMELSKAAESPLFRECVVWFKETKTFMVYSQRQWTKKSIVQVSYIYKIGDKVAAQPGSPPLKEKPIVFHVCQNHVSIMSLRDSNCFLTKKYLESKKKGAEVYCVGAGKLESNKPPSITTAIQVKEALLYVEAKQIGETDLQSLPLQFNKRVPGQIFIVWDIESAAGADKVQIPYVLSMGIYTTANFCLASIVTPQSLDRDVAKSLLFSKSFIGEDCIDQFIRYLVTRFFTNTFDDLLGDSKFTDFTGGIYLFTYNGARYDHPLIVKSLMPYNLEIIGGGLNDPRSMIIQKSVAPREFLSAPRAVPRDGRGGGQAQTIADQYAAKVRKYRNVSLIFNDFCCLHPSGRLIDTCKTLMPMNPRLWKSEYDIAGKNLAFFKDPTNLRDIVKYCEQDVTALAACILVNISNFNKLVLQILRANPVLELNSQDNDHMTLKTRAALVMTLMPHKFELIKMISASQWCFKVYKEYFLKYKELQHRDCSNWDLMGEANSRVYKVVREMYTGGMTVVFCGQYERQAPPEPNMDSQQSGRSIEQVTEDDETRELNVYDINSSFPGSMRGEMPFYRFKPNPTPISITMNNINTIEFNDHTLYYVEIISCVSNVRNSIFLSNPQDIFPFPTKSHLKLGRNWGTIYPRTIRNHWYWGHELDQYFKILLEVSQCGRPLTRSDFVSDIRISECYEPDYDSEVCEMERIANPNLRGTPKMEKLLLFRDYVDFFYEKKSQCKTNPNLAGLECLFKLFLNSLYGKFGQREFGDSSYCYGGDELLMTALDPQSIEIKKCSGQSTSQLPIFKVTSQKEYKGVGWLTRIASYTTMKSRMNLWSQIIRVTARFTFQKPRILYYVDTDSMFTTGHIPARFVCSRTINLWKIEFAIESVKKQMAGLLKEGLITQEELDQFVVWSAFFLAPKCYCLCHLTLATALKEIILGYLKIKGVSKNALRVTDFLELAINREIQVKQTQFNRQLGTVTVDPDFTKWIKLKVNKRKVISDDPKIPTTCYEDIEEFEQHLADVGV